MKIKRGCRWNGNRSGEDGRLKISIQEKRIAVAAKERVYLGKESGMIEGKKDMKVDRGTGGIMTPDIPFAGLYLYVWVFGSDFSANGCHCVSSLTRKDGSQRNTKNEESPLKFNSRTPRRCMFALFENNVKEKKKK